MKLNLFNRIQGIDEGKLHPKFKFFIDERIKWQLSGERNILENWTNGFIDRDNKIVKEFQTTFHSSFWEFYLYAFFKEAGFTLDQEHDRPDFLIKYPYEINVEAVVANIKTGGITEDQRNLDDQLSMFIPPRLQKDFYEVLNEAITRYSNSINYKNIKIKENYSQCEWIKSEVPFIIALSSYDQINYGREYIYPMMALLYGLYYQPEINNYSQKSFIKKPNTNSDIPLGIFDNKNYENLSAIIFSCTTTIGKLTSMAISQKKSVSLNQVYNIRRDFEDTKMPYKLQIVSHKYQELLSDGIFIFHNPNSKHKIPLELFESTNATQIFINNNILASTSNTYPIVARLNVPKLFCEHYELIINKNLKLYNKYR